MPLGSFWTEEEDVALASAVTQHGEDFDLIKALSGTTFGSRTAHSLKSRFWSTTQEGWNPQYRGWTPWTEEDDAALASAVGEHGEDFDRIKASSGTTFGERTVQTIKKRFYIIKKKQGKHSAPWTEEEEIALASAVGEHGEDFDRIKASSGTTFGSRSASALKSRFDKITKSFQRHESDGTDLDSANSEFHADCPACNGSHSSHVCGKGVAPMRDRRAINDDHILKVQEAKGELGWFEAQLAQAGVDMDREIRVGRARLVPLELIEDATATVVAMGDRWRKVPVGGNCHYRYEGPAGECFTNRSNAEAVGMPRTLARAEAPAIEQQEREEDDEEEDEEDKDDLEAEVVTTKKRKRKEKTNSVII